MAARGVGPGTRATCRHCGGPIQAGPQAYSWQALHWLHSDGERKCPDSHDPYSRGEPKEYCVYIKNDSDQCLRAVKHEDIAAGMFACGFHMRQEVADKERRERNAKEAAQRAEREEIEAWEIGVYQEAESYLRTVLGDELFGADHCFREYYGGRRILQASVDVDWFDLKKAIINLVEKVNGERQD